MECFTDQGPLSNELVEGKINPVVHTYGIRLFFVWPETEHGGCETMLFEEEILLEFLEA
jgi:hypothetical protein